MGGITGNLHDTVQHSGITHDATGTLKLDAAKFDAALAKDPGAVSRLFTLEDRAWPTRLGDYLKDRLADGGEIAARDASIAARRKDTRPAAKSALDARMAVVPGAVPEAVHCAGFAAFADAVHLHLPDPAAGEAVRLQASRTPRLKSRALRPLSLLAHRKFAYVGILHAVQVSRPTSPSRPMAESRRPIRIG